MALKHSLSLVCLLAIPRLALGNGESQALNLMPMPAHVTRGEGVMRLDSSFDVTVHGPADDRLTRAIRRFVEHIGYQTGIKFLNNPTAQGSFVVECKADSPDIPQLGEDESYELEVSINGARLLANTVTGVMRGLETMRQLVSRDGVSFYLPAVQIEDKPRFAWRGLMLDVSRHWMPVGVVLRNLDAMAAVKMNVFHWHVSDDQGFRIESKLYPKLQQLGSDGNYYTQDEVRSVIAYARDRGIRVLPEFDMPGHTSAWFAAYPEYASAPGPYKIERRWGILEPVLDPSRKEVFDFLDRLLGEMMSLFPDEYFHIGGDEVLDTQWKHNAAIQKFAADHKLKTSEDLQGYFTKQVEDIVRRHGKKMIGWDEVLRTGLSSDSIIHSWRGQKSLADAAVKGYRGVLSYGYYLDHVRTTAFYYGTDPMDGIDNLTPEQAARILGGEACMWTEYVNEDTVDSRIWPRSAAIGERLWSARELKDTDSMYARMAAISRVLDSSGAEHRSNYHRLLDRLAGAHPVRPVEVLADAVEALGIAGRRGEQKYTSLVPLNRLADTAWPESEPVRQLSLIAGRLAAEPSKRDDDEERLRSTFTEWRDNHARLLPAIRSNFLLRDVTSVSENLSKVGAIGLEALEYVESGKAAPAAWVAERKEFLNAAEQPNAEVVLAAVRPVRMLVDAAQKARSTRAEVRK